MKEVTDMCSKHKAWIKAAGSRALRTFCQTAIATIGTSTVMGEVNWAAVGSASVLAAILSILTSLAGLPECQAVDEPTDLAA